MSQSVDRLTGMLGFDPMEKQSVTKSQIQSIIDDVKKERAGEARKKAKEKIVKLLEYADALKKVDTDYQAARTRCEEQINELLADLEKEISDGPTHG